VAKILPPLEVARQPPLLFAAPPVILLHHFGYINSWRLRNSLSASLLSQIAGGDSGNCLLRVLSGALVSNQLDRWNAGRDSL